MCVSETREALPGGARSRLESPGAPSITKEPLISHHDHFADTRPTRVHHPLPNADRFALVIYSSTKGQDLRQPRLLAPTVVLLGSSSTHPQKEPVQNQWLISQVAVETLAAA